MKVNLNLVKSDANPILTVNPAVDWESQAVFNCGVCYKDGYFHMLYRAIGEYENYISRLGYARSSDGVNFTRMSDKPVLSPELPYEKWGCEDPRIIMLEGEIYITYVVLSRSCKQGAGVIRTALAKTKDFYTYERLGVITPDIAIDKDVVIFPEKINGKYVMLHRPHNWVNGEIKKEGKKLLILVDGNYVEWDLPEVPERFPDKPSIWMAYSDDLLHWSGHHILIEPKFLWENWKIGGGCPPIKTKKGWLLLNHGVERETGKTNYRASLAMLDLKDPSKVIYRPEEPILSPELKYELLGDVPNVVFPEGAVLKEGKLYMYYGGGDKCINLATSEVSFE
jgi:predicted GH43/DUF377 family glycosyl hydrolase